MSGIEFDWDRFEAEGRALDARVRAVKEDLKRQRALFAPQPAAANSVVREQPPADTREWERRFDRLERLLTETLSTVTELKADVATLKVDVAALNARVGSLEGDVSGLKAEIWGLKTEVGDLKAGVGGVKAEVRAIRERMVTKVEFEGMRSSIDIMTDGYFQTQARLTDVADLLKRYLVS